MRGPEGRDGWMTRAAGRWIVGISLLHLAYGLFFGRTHLAEIASDRFWNAVDPHLTRQFAFWFVAFAFPGLLTGLLVARMGARGERPPGWLGTSVILFAAVCCVLMPASGFWLFFVPGGMLFLEARPAAKPVRPPGVI